MHTNTFNIIQDIEDRVINSEEQIATSPAGENIYESANKTIQDTFKESCKY